MCIFSERINWKNYISKVVIFYYSFAKVIYLFRFSLSLLLSHRFTNVNLVKFEANSLGRILSFLNDLLCEREQLKLFIKELFY